MALARVIAMNEGQHREVEVCPTCGTTRLTFDPPIALHAGEACNAVKPGNYAAPLGGVPFCELVAGHEGDHMFIVEYVEQWPREVEGDRV